MSRDKTKRKRTDEVYPYAGGNEVIDRLKEDDEEVWIVNASAGRKVLILPPGSTEQDAWSAYAGRYLEAVEDEAISLQ